MLEMHVQRHRMLRARKVRASKLEVFPSMLVGAAREETNLALPRSSKSNLSNARALLTPQAGPPEKGEPCNDVGLALQLLADLSVVPGDSGTLCAPLVVETPPFSQTDLRVGSNLMSTNLSGNTSLAGFAPNLERNALLTQRAPPPMLAIWQLTNHVLNDLSASRGFARMHRSKMRDLKASSGDIITAGSLPRAQPAPGIPINTKELTLLPRVANRHVSISARQSIARPNCIDTGSRGPSSIISSGRLRARCRNASPFGRGRHTSLASQTCFHRPRGPKHRRGSERNASMNRGRCRIRHAEELAVHREEQEALAAVSSISKATKVTVESRPTVGGAPGGPVQLWG